MQSFTAPIVYCTWCVSIIQAVIASMSKSKKLQYYYRANEKILSASQVEAILKLLFTNRAHQKSSNFRCSSTHFKQFKCYYYSHKKLPHALYVRNEVQ